MALSVSVNVATALTPHLPKPLRCGRLTHPIPQVRIPGPQGPLHTPGKSQKRGPPGSKTGGCPLTEVAWDWGPGRGMRWTFGEIYSPWQLLLEPELTGNPSPNPASLRPPCSQQTSSWRTPGQAGAHTPRPFGCCPRMCNQHAVRPIGRAPTLNGHSHPSRAAVTQRLDLGLLPIASSVPIQESKHLTNSLSDSPGCPIPDRLGGGLLSKVKVKRCCQGTTRPHPDPLSTRTYPRPCTSPTDEFSALCL